MDTVFTTAKKKLKLTLFILDSSISSKLFLLEVQALQSPNYLDLLEVKTVNGMIV